MWKLSIEDDEGNVTSLPLHHDEYGVGRAEANSIRLTDRNISRKHAKLRRGPQGWLVSDLQSYNGTYVNGVRVASEQLLQTTDIIQLGDYRIELLDEVAAQPAAPGAPAAPTAPQPIPGHHRPDRLVIVVGPTPGTEFPLDRAEIQLIGRAEDANISINHSSVSRQHAEIVALGNGRYEVVDKGSANGIRINGVELKRGILEAGDALELGDVRLRFVGAGKVFRSMVDPHLVPGGFDGSAASVRPGTKPAGANATRIIAIGVGIVAIAAIIGVVALRGSGPSTATDTGPTKVVVPTDEASAKLLKEASELVDKGDFDGAHQKVLQIPENSAARDEDVFKKVEGAWADSLFAKADKATDPNEKRAILTQITSTGTVDGQRRAKALDLLNQLDAVSPPPTARPVVNGGAVGTGAVAQAPPTKTADPTPVVVTPPPAPGAPDEAAIRKSLEPKVWAGKGTLNDIKMLKAICSHMGDRACRDRAGAMLKAKMDNP
jgi:pSer/pThr/pTyr-binding forkhead associated (FHA) protein